MCTLQPGLLGSKEPERLVELDVLIDAGNGAGCDTPAAAMNWPEALGSAFVCLRCEDRWRGLAQFVFGQGAAGVETCGAGVYGHDRLSVVATVQEQTPQWVKPLPTVPVDVLSHPPERRGRAKSAPR
ncbi:hypothetical protein AGR4B_pAt20444 [Agrobacterium tumefaciens str. CFBP 5621]|nr:hypothetical protein AGR4B_pAt20444 [Agrobacterium tumefaciens str. CFBP 5621]